MLKKKTINNIPRGDTKPPLKHGRYSIITFGPSGFNR